MNFHRNDDNSTIKEAEEMMNITNSQNVFNGPDDSTFTALFESDEEIEALKEVKRLDDPEGNITKYSTASIDAEIEEERKRLRKEYPMGGVKSSRFITTKMLMKMDKTYFDKFDETVKKGVTSVQNTLSDRGQAGIIAEASNDPTNEELQDKAYRAVQTAATEFLEKQAYRVLDRSTVITLICNEIIGFSVLDPLWRDSTVDEILCNGPKDIQIQIKGKFHKVPGCNFRDKSHLNSLIERLYGSIGKTVSRTSPIVDGRLHDYSRMAVVHDSVSPEGPNFVIRRHKEEYIPPTQIIEWGTASEELMTFLGNLVYKGCSILILGGVSTGKTTLLGALSGFYRRDHRVLVLEDNLELKLPKHKLLAAPMECKPPRPDDPSSGTTMRDLVMAALRLSPNAIVVGEVRDGAAYDLCQALNTGQYGMSTVHANSEREGIYRLISLVSQGGLMQGAAALPLIAASFDIIVKVEAFPTDGSRKIVSISEVAPFPMKNKDSGELFLPTKPIWKFVDEGLTENLKVLGHWEKVGNLSKERIELRRLDLERDLSWEELKELSVE